MADILLIAETPNAGPKGHRFLIARGNPVDARMASEFVRRAAATPDGIGDDFLAVRHSTIQSLTDRPAEEALILAGIDVHQLPDNMQKQLLADLRQCLGELAAVVDAIDWQHHGQALVVESDPLREWLNAMNLPSRRGDADQPITKSAGAQAAHRKPWVVLAGVLLLALLAAIVRLWPVAVAPQVAAGEKTENPAVAAHPAPNPDAFSKEYEEAMKRDNFRAAAGILDRFPDEQSPTLAAKRRHFRDEIYKRLPDRLNQLALEGQHGRAIQEWKQWKDHVAFKRQFDDFEGLEKKIDEQLGRPESGISEGLRDTAKPLIFRCGNSTKVSEAREKIHKIDRAFQGLRNAAIAAQKMCVGKQPPFLEWGLVAAADRYSHGEYRKSPSTVLIDADVRALEDWNNFINCKAGCAALPVQRYLRRPEDKAFAGVMMIPRHAILADLKAECPSWWNSNSTTVNELYGSLRNFIHIIQREKILE